MTDEKRDLVVVGGGPAGISTALFVQHYAPSLARRMVVLERERYPRDKYCAGAIGGRALRLLARIGVTVDVPHVPIEAMSLQMDGARWVLPEPDMGIVVRRIEFDHALARAAMERGVEVRDGAPVESVEPGDAGVRVRLEGGETIEAQAVVGADGVGGAVRRSAGFARGKLRAQVLELDTETVEGDPPWGAIHFDFHFEDLNGYAWDFPTLVDGRKMMCRGVYRIVDDDHPKDDVRARLARFLGEKGLDITRYRQKPFAERGFEPDEPISRPRVLLVGEAAGIDIATGEGIAQAIQYGALAGGYLVSAFERGDLGFADWLARVRAGDVGRQLRLRHWGYQRFYFKDRPVMEKMLRMSPGVIRLGMRQFAGKPNGPLAWARTVADAAPLLARLGPRQVLSVLRGSS